MKQLSTKNAITLIAVFVAVVTLCAIIVACTQIGADKTADVKIETNWKEECIKTSWQTNGNHTTDQSIVPAMREDFTLIISKSGEGFSAKVKTTGTTVSPCAFVFSDNANAVLTVTQGTITTKFSVHFSDESSKSYDNTTYRLTLTAESGTKISLVVAK